MQKELCHYLINSFFCEKFENFQKFRSKAKKGMDRLKKEINLSEFIKMIQNIDLILMRISFSSKNEFITGNFLKNFL